MTLIEILVVLAIVSTVLTGVIMGSGQLASSRLKQSATLLAGAVRTAFTHASATSRSVRLAFDLKDQTIALEEADAPMLVQTKDRTGTGGAEPVSVAEKQAVAETERIVKGPQAPRAQFHPVKAFGFGGEGARPRSLARGIQFREIQTSHDVEPRTSGRAYLYFWPGGLTERANIQIRIGDSPDANNTLSLMIAPLTGKTMIKSGPVALTLPSDDKEASERIDNGSP